MQNSLINEISEYKNKYGDEKTVKKYEDKLLSLRNFKILIWFYKNVKTTNLEKLKKFVISTRNIYFIYRFFETFEEFSKTKDIEIFNAFIENDFLNHSQYYTDQSHFFFYEDEHYCLSEEKNLFLIENFILDQIFLKSFKNEIFQSIIKYGDIQLIEEVISICHELNIDSTELENFFINEKITNRTDRKKIIETFIDKLNINNFYYLVSKIPNSEGIFYDITTEISCTNSFNNGFESDNTKCIYDLVKKINETNISKIDTTIDKKVIQLIKTENFEELFYIMNFCNINTINKVIKFILSANISADKIYKFITTTFTDCSNYTHVEIPEELLNKLLTQIDYPNEISCYIYIKEIIKNVIYINIEKIENYLIEHQMYTLIIDFATSIVNANISKLEEAIITSNDPNLIYTFMSKVPNANPYKLNNLIFKTPHQKFLKKPNQ